jgi:hypothetical protein
MSCPISNAYRRGEIFVVPTGVGAVLLLPAYPHEKGDLATAPRGPVYSSKTHEVPTAPAETRRKAFSIVGGTNV